MASNAPVTLDLCDSSDDDKSNDEKIPPKQNQLSRASRRRRRQNAGVVIDLSSPSVSPSLNRETLSLPGWSLSTRAVRSARRYGDNSRQVVRPSKRKDPPPSSTTSTSDSNFKRPARQESDAVEVIGTSTTRKTSVYRVLEVFPDVEIEYAEKVLRDSGNQLDMTLAILAERAYPKNKSHAAGVPQRGGAATVLVKRAKVQPKYDYTAPSSFEPSESYIQEAIQQLLFHFPFVSTKGIKHFLKEHDNHFTLVWNRLLDALKEGGDASSDDKEIQKFQNLKLVWVKKRPTQRQREKVGDEYCVKRVQLRLPPDLTDPILKDEVNNARIQLEEWMLAAEEKIKRQEARKRAENRNNGFECGICFEKVPIEEMVACRNEGHLFCMECIESYANTQVFSNANLGVIKSTGKPSCELVCCDASGCQSGFHEGHLERVLSVKTLEKYNELAFRANLEAAGLSDVICTCPKCGFQADLPPNLVVFECPVDDCRHASCRKCGKAPHIPLRCEEVVQKTRENEGRLKVEEAMAEAKIRKCPKCKTSFVKSDGCNKMTCRCGTKMCYVCRKQLTGENPYSHFCQTAHCTHKSCGMCTLYSNAEEDDVRAMREAGLTAAHAYQEEVKNKENGAEVNIDVDKIIGKSPAKISARKTRAHRARA